MVARIVNKHQIVLHGLPKDDWFTATTKAMKIKIKEEIAHEITEELKRVIEESRIQQVNTSWTTRDLNDLYENLIDEIWEVIHEYKVITPT